MKKEDIRIVLDNFIYVWKRSLQYPNGPYPGEPFGPGVVTFRTRTIKIRKCEKKKNLRSENCSAHLVVVIL